MSTEVVEQSVNDKIDQLEVLISEGERIEFPLNHTIANGWYMREVFMPKSELPKHTFVTSLVHGDLSPFFMLKGKIALISENDGEEIIEAPYYGMTLPNTRRAARIIEDTIWVTVHKTDIVPKSDSKEDILEAVRLIEESLIKPYENALIKGHLNNNVFIPSSKEIIEDVNTERYD